MDLILSNSGNNKLYEPDYLSFKLMSIDKRTLIELCDVSMQQKFKECDTILRKLKTWKARNHVLDLLDNFEKVVSHDSLLKCYIVKERYMIYYNKRSRSDCKYTCQCKFRSYQSSICAHVAVILIHNILTFGKCLVEEYLIYIEKKKTYRRILRYRTPKFLTKN
jgi:hypothetical protein